MDVNTNNQALLMRLLDASAKRRDVLLANLANTETPGFQRKTVQFEELLQGALARGQDASSVEPKVAVDKTSPARDDGNNVNLELELNGLRENRLAYDAYTAILGTHFEMMRTAIESGR
ncbi:MAG TPA: flagellar basal body rod protein FlgB [Planctomycetota bacterium]|nr:flagellar basal body rod protein FlgB [Planctomycetota bacterium]